MQNKPEMHADFTFTETCFDAKFAEVLFSQMAYPAVYDNYLLNSPPQTSPKPVITFPCCWNITNPDPLMRGRRLHKLYFPHCIFLIDSVIER